MKKDRLLTKLKEIENHFCGGFNNRYKYIVHWKDTCIETKQKIQHLIVDLNRGKYD